MAFVAETSAVMDNIVWHLADMDESGCTEPIDVDDLKEKIVEALGFHMTVDFEKINIEKLQDSGIIFGGSNAIFCGFYDDHQISIIYKDGVISVQPWDHDPGCCGASCDALGCCEHTPAGWVPKHT